MNEEHTNETDQLLRELIKVQKKHTNATRVLLAVNVCVMAVIIIAAVILVPRTTKLISDSERSIKDIENIAAMAEESFDGIDELIKNANSVLEDSANGMNEAIENLNSVDFESLNKAIKDLADTVAPMAEFMRMFN